MSKKLLEEGTIRSFMKLANLQPLSEKFISEKYGMKEEEEKEDEKKVDEVRHVSDREDDERAADRLEEVVEEEKEDELEEGKESEGRPASKKEAPKGTSLAGKTLGKMDAAKNAPKDAKLTPAKHTTHHSDKPDSIETKDHSNAPKKNNSQFEVVSESLEEEIGTEEAYTEEMDSPEGGAEDMGGGAESGPHKDKMKGLIRQMLENLKEMGSEYGMTMEISDEGSASPEGEEAPPLSAPPEGGEEEGGEMMQEKLDEMVEKLTKRVAARLVKESKKKR